MNESQVNISQLSAYEAETNQLSERFFGNRLITLKLLRSWEERMHDGKHKLRTKKNERKKQIKK